jgi:hypothetical protein
VTVHLICSLLIVLFLGLVLSHNNIIYSLEQVAHLYDCGKYLFLYIIVLHSNHCFNYDKRQSIFSDAYYLLLR